MTIKSILVGMCLWAGVSAFAQHNPPVSDEAAPTNEVRVFAPNAFTPDGDLYNNHWRVFTEGADLYDFHLTIYDRSGQVIWESFNVDGEWDGNFGGNPAQAGIYLWVIDTKSPTSDERSQFNGFIMLMR